MRERVQNQRQIRGTPGQLLGLRRLLRRSKAERSAEFVCRRDTRLNNADHTASRVATLRSIFLVLQRHTKGLEHGPPILLQFDAVASSDAGVYLAGVCNVANHAIQGSWTTKRRIGNVYDGSCGLFICVLDQSVHLVAEKQKNDVKVGWADVASAI